MDLTKDLLKFDLTRNEAAVYAALLSLGTSKASGIIRKTKLHRMLIYTALDSLIERRLVSVAHKSGVRLFQAADPVVLKEYAKELANVASELVPALRELQHERGEVVATQTFIGHEGLVTAMSEVVESAARSKDKIIRILGGAPAGYAYEAFGKWYPEYVRLVAKKKVKKMLISPSRTVAGFSNFRKEKNTELRTMDQGLSSPTYTRITDEMVSIEIYKPQLVTIHIRNKAIAQSYIEFFDLLWKTAKRV